MTVSIAAFFPLCVANATTNVHRSQASLVAVAVKSTKRRDPTRWSRRRTQDPRWFARENHPTEAKTGTVVIEDGRDQPVVVPVDRLRLEGKQRIPVESRRYNECVHQEENAVNDYGDPRVSLWSIVADAINGCDHIVFRIGNCVIVWQQG